MNSATPLWFASVLALCCLAACPSPAMRAPDPDPADVVRAYHRALHGERPAEAWSLLAESARDGLDEAGFVELYARQREALLAQADALLAVVEAAPAAETARVVIGDTELTLVRTRAGWRVQQVGAAPTRAP